MNNGVQSLLLSYLTALLRSGDFTLVYQMGGAWVIRILDMGYKITTWIGGVLYRVSQKEKKPQSLDESYILWTRKILNK